MESESGTNNTKISDSGYSVSGSNTISQGSVQSKSRHSGDSNSSRSSGYGGAPKTAETGDSGYLQLSKRNKDREHKKKKQESAVAFGSTSVTVIAQPFTVPSEIIISAPSSVKTTMGMEVVPSPVNLEILVPECIEALAEPLLAAPPPETESLLVTTEEENLPAWNEKDAEKDLDSEPKKDISESDPIPSSQPEVNEGFCCVISMYDGVVLYTTPSLTNVLGFPKDMWLGHSFIDFVHPKDRETFASQVSSSVALPVVDSHGKLKDVKDYLYVCLRRHGTVKTQGVSAVEKPSVSYQAFHLTVTIKQMTEFLPEATPNDPKNGLFLVIIAVPVHSAYKVPGEKKVSAKIGMRHTATCIFSYVDPDVVAYFGFLPQDMLGKSVFDFYHPEDMPFLKEVYKSVMKTCQINGSVVRSKPYRFLVQNGCFAMIETEWSSVVNPWSKRLEFVISLHQVLQGPLNPNVFDVTSDQEYKKIPEEVIKQGKVIQSEIIQLLTQEIPRPVEQEVSERCRNLASFMENLMNSSKLKIDTAQEFNPTIPERDSVMLGEISPHHDFCDSKSSSETPPSYNQLNYKENITRFFQSNPKTTVTSDESNCQAMDTDGKNIQDCASQPNSQKRLSPMQNSGASGCDSAGNLSSGSNPNIESGTTSGTNTSNDDYKPPHLTETVLVRHNEDMEKIMIQKHKKERSHIKDRETKKSHQKLETYANDKLRDDTNEHNHGVKRSGSRSWEIERHKLTKHDHENGIKATKDNANKNNNSQNNIVAPNCSNQQSHASNAFPSGNGMNMWPPLSLAVAGNSQQFPPLGLTPNPQYNSGMLPVYLVPTFAQPRPVDSSQRYQVQYMPANLLYGYNPIFLPQPVLCPTVPVFPVPMTNSSSSMSPEERLLGNNTSPPKVNSGSAAPAPSGPSGNSALPPPEQRHFGNTAPSDKLSCDRPPPKQHRFGNTAPSDKPPCDRPPSQATSVNVEPGSRMGSLASASVVNKALSECSRKDLGLLSVCSPDTPLVSPPDGEITQTEQFDTKTKPMDTAIKRPKQPESNYRTNRIDEDSSCYSSSYSSLLKTDTGCGSTDDSNSNNNTNRIDDEIMKRNRKVYPMRKKDPPWVESVSISQDLIYRYQVAVKDLEDILKTDLNTLQRTEQPMMVNDQLQQLYIEIELEGLSKALTLEEGISSSSSSSSDENPTSYSNPNIPNRPKRLYSSLMDFYEEDAPLPPTEGNS